MAHLRTYRAKRDFTKTAEPRGRVVPGQVLKGAGPRTNLASSAISFERARKKLDAL